MAGSEADPPLPQTTIIERLTGATPREQAFFLRGYDPFEAQFQYAFPADFEAMVDFAADPGLSSSRYIRAYALELGLRGLLTAHASEAPLTDSQAAIVRQAQTILPREYFNPWIRTMLTEARGYWPRVWPPYYGKYPIEEYENAYHKFFVLMARNEGISDHALAGDETDEELAYDAIPVSTGLLLQEMMQCRPHELPLLPPRLAEEAMDLILNFRDPELVTKTAVFAETAQLSRFSIAGDEHDVPIEFLHSIALAQRLEYIQAFNTLYESAKGLRHVFPQELGDQVAAAARSLLANALFAAQAHLQQDNITKTAVHLRNGAALPLELSGDEPLQLLRQLDNIFRTLRAAVMSETARSILALRGKGFQVYRFIDLATSEPSRVSLYTRPAFSPTYDHRYEYGRPGKGVDASINYSVQVDDSRLQPLHKSSATLDIISIRLDREQDDSIALDIGSVLGGGNDARLGTRIGRMLAWGNTLRAAAAGKEISLNHVRDSLDQTYGHAQPFETVARRHLQRINAMRANPAELRHYCSGVVLRRLLMDAAVKRSS